MDPKNYHFEFRPDLIKLYSWSYKFYNAVDKKIKDCKIYSPFSHLKNRCFIFNREFDRSKFHQVNLNEDGRKLQSIYNTHQSQILN